jgi:cytochrome c553
MTLDRHVPLRLDDAPAARGGGRLRPGPPWRRWSIVELRRRRLLAELRDYRSSAREVGDLVVAELLDAPIEALASLVEPVPPPAPPEPEPTSPLPAGKDMTDA